MNEIVGLSEIVEAEATQNSFGGSMESGDELSVIEEIDEQDFDRLPGRHRWLHDALLGSQ